MLIHTPTHAHKHEHVHTHTHKPTHKHAREDKTYTLSSNRRAFLRQVNQRGKTGLDDQLNQSLKLPRIDHAGQTEVKKDQAKGTTRHTLKTRVTRAGKDAGIQKTQKPRQINQHRTQHAGRGKNVGTSVPRERRISYSECWSCGRQETDSAHQL